MHQAQFTLQCDSVNDASILHSSLSPELQQGIPKTNIVLEQNKNILSLTISTSDCSSLRAACNSYLRWLSTALQVRQLI